MYKDRSLVFVNQPFDHSSESKIFYKIPEEEFWLRKFTSLQTRNTYKTAVKQFLKILNITTREHLKNITQDDILMYREQLMKIPFQDGSFPSNSSVCAKMSAISSLYCHLLER